MSVAQNEVTNEDLYAQQARINSFLERGQLKVKTVVGQVQIATFIRMAVSNNTSSKDRNDIISALTGIQDDLEAIFDRQVAPLHDALEKVTTNSAKYTLGTDLKAYRAKGLIGFISRFIAKVFDGVSFDPRRVDEKLLGKFTQLQGPFMLGKEYELSPKEEATKQMIEKLLDPENSMDSDVVDAFALSSDEGFESFA